MSNIFKHPIKELGSRFVSKHDLPEGKEEYFFRDRQRKEVIGDRRYNPLSADEMAVLKRNGNTADDWNNITVAEGFNPELVKNCRFFGKIRIGKLENCFLRYRDLQIPVGIYNSTVCAADFGDNVAVDRVGFLAHFVIGDEVILVHVDEMSTSPKAKFGNGILKKDEPEELRIWLEVCNEKGGRKVLPFEGMLPGDAYLWSKYRDDTELMQRFVVFTEKQSDVYGGHYSCVGRQTVIKYSKTIKDVKIGEGAYIKGVNKLKNLTINSRVNEIAQIGEGCELVNGIIGYGCRIFYGVKAVRFVMAPYSNLKYGARLINSYLGSNATISCCEVLNSLIFPSHEQHHNNSFLCAALVMGQSNLAAAATIGSNHNSRSPDGEIIAKRGFWPGLSVSLKHNSRFGSFSLIAKGDYPYEINLLFPFALLIHDFSQDQLVIMPAYWFMYNMYALARNVWKLPNRDYRTEKIHRIEFDYLAPDTVEEMFEGMRLIEEAVGKSVHLLQPQQEAKIRKTGKEWLLHHPQEIENMKVYIDGMENSKRKVQLIKVRKAYAAYRRMIIFYAVRELLKAFEQGRWNRLEALKSRTGAASQKWLNIGGQLIPEHKVNQLKEEIKTAKINSWKAVHQRYLELGAAYDEDKLNHAVSVLSRMQEAGTDGISAEKFKEWVKEFSETSAWILEQVKTSRIKDYRNPFRKMVYDNDKEMDEVIGRFSEDDFLKIVENNHKQNCNLAQIF